MQSLLLLASLALDALRNPYTFGLLVTGFALFVGLFKRQFALTFFLTVAITFVVTKIAKALFKVPRPDTALVEMSDYRFPSLHASLAGAFFVSVWWYAFFSTDSLLLKIAITAVAISCVLFVAWSRIYLGVHQYIDVIIGVLLGAIISAAVHFFILEKI